MSFRKCKPMPGHPKIRPSLGPLVADGPPERLVGGPWSQGKRCGPGDSAVCGPFGLPA